MNDPRILSGQEMVNRRLLAPYDKALRRTVDHIDALTEALDEERSPSPVPTRTMRSGGWMRSGRGWRSWSGW